MTKIVHSLFIIFIISFINFNNYRGQSLYEYTCLTDHYDMSLKGWMQRKSRKEDSLGIITQENKYNALTICVYGILNYYKFKEEKDSVFYFNSIDQFKYFLDSSKIIYSDKGESIGLPYNYNYADLKAGWISGMTQGFAISYLLRYYDLTKDKRCLDYVNKIANLLLKQDNEGGSISTLEGGYYWIEEYPNSKKSPQVLNGFINGLIGVYEFLQYFPKHERAREVHDSSFKALLNNLEKYDRPSWTNYNSKGSPVSEHYMRYELSELEQLYFMYNEPEFLRQIMIWSFFAMNKSNTKYNMYKYPSYKYAIPFEKNNGLFFTDSTSTSKQISSIQNFKITQKTKDVTSKLFKAKKVSALSFDENLNYADVYFSAPIELKKLYQLNNTNLKTDKINDSVFRFYSDSIFSDIKFKLKSSQKKLSIDSIKTISFKNVEGPKFFIDLIPNSYWITAGKEYRIKLNEVVNSENLIFLYRFNKKEDLLPKTKWHRNQYIMGNNLVLKPKESGYYQFMAVAVNTKYGTQFSNFSITDK